MLLDRAQPLTAALQLLLAGALLFPLIPHLGVEAGYIAHTGKVHRVALALPSLELLKFPGGKRALRFNAFYNGDPVAGPLVLDQKAIIHVARAAAGEPEAN